MINWDMLRVAEPDFCEELESILRVADWEKSPLTKDDIYKTTYIMEDKIIFQSLGMRRVFKSWDEFADFIFNKYGVVIK